MEIKDWSFIVVMERLNTFSSHPAASHTDTLKQEGEEKSFYLKTIAQAESISREIITYNKTVIIIDYSVIILIYVLDITRFRLNTYKVRT